MQIITRKEAKENGLKRYFTGEPCRRGHLAERAISGSCLECTRKTKLSDELKEARRVHGDKVITKKEAVAAGLNRYFIGRECKNGHVHERYISTNQCVLCMRLYHVKKTREGVVPTRLSSNESLQLFVSEEVRAKVVTREQADKQGLKRYFTGLPCKNGHLSERKITSGDCLECIREAHAQKMQDDLVYRKRRKAWSDGWRHSPAGKQNAEMHRLRKLVLKRATHEINIIKNSQLHWYENPQQFLIDREIKRKFAEARRNAVAQATPDWVDVQELKEVEQLRSEITARTGIKYHVDHYYPIQSDVICGLNVPWNLQIITAEENHAKSNKMPEEFYGPNHTMNQPLSLAM